MESFWTQPPWVVSRRPTQQKAALGVTNPWGGMRSRALLYLRHPQAILAMAAFLQGFLNFCAGCFVFGYLMKFGLVSEAVYRMHVNTRCVCVCVC